MLFRYSVILSVFFGFWSLGYLTEPALAQTTTCSVRDVIRAASQGLSNREIHRKCSDIDVKDCSLTQVIRMAKDGQGAREIYKKCGRRS